MFEYFVKLWEEKHEGKCLFTGADAKQAQAIWRQCRADNPTDPWAEFEIRTRKIMKEHPIDSFKQLIVWWNSAKRKVKIRKSIYDTP